MVMVAMVMWGSAAARGAEALESLARVLSPEMRRIEVRAAEIGKELGNLPQLRPEPLASRYGYRSGNIERQDDPQWVQLDLQRSESIDRIVAMPVHIPMIEKRGAGYGFPLRFRIEIADDPEMNDAVTVVDRTAEDFENPGRYPVDFRLESVKGRYVRFTSTKHFPAEEGYMWALEELIVLSGNRNPAIGKRVLTSSNFDRFPNWASVRIQDGQSALGMPGTTEPSPTSGYLSAVADNPRVEKWLILDLGQEFPIDEIRLLPVVSGRFEHLGLKAFPRAYEVECATDRGFAEITWRHRSTTNNQVGYPGGCAVTLTPGKMARFIRLKATELWSEGFRYGYALSEIQVYSGNENVASGKSVVASDSSKEEGWSPGALVDGFTSQYRIIELPAYLDLIGRRGELEREADDLARRKEVKIRMARSALTYGGGGFGLFLVVGWGWAVARQRIMREKAVAQLRDQIARDLHDDIGSNLGGIVLLSEIGNAHSSDPQAREDFRIIKEAADQASASMRDIVWLIGRGHTGLRDQVAMMRQSVQLILGDREVSLSVSPEPIRDRSLSLLFRRHVLFAFKESLNNIRKHSHAAKVEVGILLDTSCLTFIVRDNGAGFDPVAADHSGHGLANLRRRAERLGGTVRIESTPGEGSVVTFSAPLKS